MNVVLPKFVVQLFRGDWVTPHHRGAGVERDGPPGAAPPRPPGTPAPPDRPPQPPPARGLSLPPLPPQPHLPPSPLQDLNSKPEAPRVAPPWPRAAGTPAVYCLIDFVAALRSTLLSDLCAAAIPRYAAGARRPPPPRTHPPVGLTPTGSTQQPLRVLIIWGNARNTARPSRVLSAVDPAGFQDPGGWVNVNQPEAAPRPSGLPTELPTPPLRTSPPRALCRLRRPRPGPLPPIHMYRPWAADDRTP